MTALAVDPRMRVHLALNAASNTIHLTWTAVPGMVYRVVVRSGIDDPAWVDASDDITPAAETATWEAPIDPQVPQRFYAVRRVR